MSSGVKDIQLYELKDTILQLNKTISDQNKLIESLQKMLEDRNASEAKKDQLIANLEVYLYRRLYRSVTEPLPASRSMYGIQRRRVMLQNRMSLN